MPRFIEFRCERLWVIDYGCQSVKFLGHLIQHRFERLWRNTVFASGIVQRAEALIDPLEFIRLYGVIVAVPFKCSDDLSELRAKTVDLVG